MPLSELWEILYLSPRSNSRILHIAECGFLVLRIREVLLSCWIICLNQNNNKCKPQPAPSKLVSDNSDV